MPTSFYKLILIASLLSLLAACSSTQKSRVGKFEPASFHDINGWSQDKHAAALKTFINSCEKFLNHNEEKNISSAVSIGGSAIDWQVPCLDAAKMQNFTDLEARKFFERWFIPYKVLDENGNEKGTLTGYYQIELEGSKKRTSKYKYPIYKRPDELDSVKGTSNIEHGAINKGILEGKGLEIAWVDNRARLYFMHIQGSGVVKLKEGGEIYLSFHDHNGFGFKGLSEAIRDKDLKFNSMVALIDWLHENPEIGQEILERDPSYVFFRNMKEKHAVGGQGVPLKPERSLAVDYGLYPYGAPIWIEAQLTETEAFKARPYKRLFIAQDTGGAIRGALRGDVFFGRGKKAEKVASQFKARANFYVLFPRTIKVPPEYQVAVVK